MVGAAHARLAAGAPAEDVLACLENATALGERQVLALSRVLAPKTIEHVCTWLASRESKGLTDHIASALDGEVPLEPHLLRRAGPQINSPARLDRVQRILRDGPAELQRLAFYALVDAKVYSVEAGTGRRAHRTRRPKTASTRRSDTE